MQDIGFYDNYVKSGEYSKSDIFTNLDRPFPKFTGNGLVLSGWVVSVGRLQK